MRFACMTLASAIVCASSLKTALAEEEQQQMNTRPTIVMKKKYEAIFADDLKFWDRTLGSIYDGGISSMPMPSPTPTRGPKTSPPAPSSAPLPGTDAPTTSQLEPCNVDVDLKCALASDPDMSCDTLEEVTELQCTGCAPTTLCFTYIAAACPGADDFPPGILSCTNFNGGPQVMADVTISNGRRIFVDGTFQLGSEFCISDSGAQLPSELFVFINAPGSGTRPEPNQIVVIDSTCTGKGLKLLNTYGSLQLVHYINCNGDRDCFVPIEYSYEVKNAGDSSLTISKLNRTLNGATSNLIEDVDPADLILASDQIFVRSELVVADCCSRTSYFNTVNVAADGDSGSTCHDDDVLNFEKVTSVPSSTASPTPSTPKPTPLGTTEATAFPTPSTPEPTTQETAEPTLFPTLSTLEPTSQETVEPSASTTAPTNATPEPSQTSEVPTVVTLEPTADTPAPTRGSQQPTQETQEPTNITPEPSRATPEPTVSPSVQASTEPSQTTREPTSSPSGPLSQSPSFSPSDSPSDSLSLSPTRAPIPVTSLPSFRLSDSPSFVTAGPSMVSSESPSSGPSFSSPSDMCSVSINVECIPSDGAKDCDSIPIPETKCEEQPFALVFRYNGGNCSQSFNLQPESLFQCENFLEGPPNIEGESSYITIIDTDERGTVYHEGFIPVGGEVTVSDSGNALGDNMNVTIYSSAETFPENILQTMVLQSSCASNLFLKDRYGSIQLAIFANDRQGVQSCFFDVVYEYTVENVGEENDAVLQILESQTNLGTINLTALVTGVIVSPGNTTTFNRTVQLDLTARETHTASTMLVALSPTEIPCTADDFFSFEAGNPLPPTIPTATPTFSPTTTLFPTPDPEDTACKLLPLITCAVVDGPSVGCDDLRAPTLSTCLGDSSPYELVFLYNGGSCPNDPANGFRCDDQNGGPSNRDNVWLTVMSRGEIVFGQAVNQKNFIKIRGAIDQTTDLTISSIVNNAPAILLQTMRIRTRCQEEDDLTLLNSYGALQLIGFANGPSGPQSALATVQVTYQVSILGAIRAVIQRAESVGAFAGERILRSTPSGSIGRRDILNLGVEIETISLTTNTPSFAFSLIVNGTSAPTPALDCGGTEVLTFTVQ